MITKNICLNLQFILFMSGFDTVFNFECIPLCISRLCLDLTRCLILNAFHCAFLAFLLLTNIQVSKTQLFWLRHFVGLVDFKFKFCFEFCRCMFVNHRNGLFHVLMV